MTSEDNKRIASADIPAVVVPSGESITIPSGSKMVITHRLGGNFTVSWEYGMARISGIYAQAIGEKPHEKSDSDDANSPWDEEKLWDALRLVYDPEIPVSIVDLGLIYSLRVFELPDNSDLHRVEVKMTLTAPGCGMGPSIAADAKARLEQVTGVSEAIVEIVWDPPWNQEMISESGKMILGLI